MIKRKKNTKLYNLNKSANLAPSTTMSVLYPVPLDKLKSQDHGHENSPPKIIINKSQVPAVKKLKLNSALSSQVEPKQVLTQISMNHQQQSDNQQQKQRKRRVSDGSTKVKPAPGVAVARRNARERNRVKQVNNGFSLLRDHIPLEIAELYEQNGRGGAKKLSKVETLKMAVEYIRNLEQMLNLDSSNDSMPPSPANTSSFANMSEASLPATPPPEIQQPFFYALKPHSNVLETEITIVNGQQYIRIPGTNTFQLVTPEFFENEENIHPNPSSHFTTIQIHPPSSPHSHLPLMIQPPGGIMGSGGQTPSLNSFVSEINSSTSVINSSETPAGSISPYSGHSSLSPAPSHHVDNISGNGNNIMMEDGRFSISNAKRSEEDYKTSSMQFAEQMMITSDTSHYENIILKQESISEDSMFDDSSLSNENMMEAMQWWEHQQSLENSSTPWKNDDSLI